MEYGIKDHNFEISMRAVLCMSGMDTFFEDMVETISEVDAALEGIVCYPFEDLAVEASEGVMEEEFLVECDGGEELLLELQVSGLGEHASTFIKW